MAEFNVRFDLRFGPRLLSGGIAAAMLLAGAAELGSEKVTLTTYYPAPSGIYTRMITTGDTLLARDGGGVGIGTANPLVKLHVKATDAAQPNADIALESRDSFKWTMSSQAGTGSWIVNRDIPGTLPAITAARNGDVSIGGALRTTYLQVTGTAAAGAACSGSGLIAQDGAGALLSCQSGRWRPAAMPTFKTEFYQFSTNPYPGHSIPPFTCPVAGHKILSCVSIESPSGASVCGTSVTPDGTGCNLGGCNGWYGYSIICGGF